MRTTALLCTLLAVVAGGCKKKVVTEEGTGDAGPVNPVEIALQIAAISPSTLTNGVPTTIEVIGAGFLQGAVVRVGDTIIDQVVVQDGNVLRAELPGLPVGTYDLAVQNPDANEVVRRGGLVVTGQQQLLDVQRCGRVVVYFATDSSSLDTTSRERLKGVMDCYMGSQGPIRIEGHADARGTTDYNLALGQRRAETVQQLLMAAGVGRSRQQLMSYGEERPAQQGYGESVWARNRRVEVVLEMR